MYLVWDNKIDAPRCALTAVDAGTEQAGMELSNLKVPALSDFYRMLDIADLGSFYADFYANPSSAGDATPYVDFVALVGTNLTRHRNIAPSGDDLQSSAWTQTNITPTLLTTAAPAAVPAMAAWSLLGSGGPPCELSRAVSLAGLGPSSIRYDFQLQGIFRWNGGSSNVRLQIEETATPSNKVVYDFDLDNQVINSSSQVGFTLKDGDITDLGNSWALCRLYCRAQIPVTDFTVRITALNASFVPSSASTLGAGAVNWRTVSGGALETVEHYLGKTADSKAVFNITSGNNASTASGVETGWLDWAQHDSQWESWPYTSRWHRFGTPFADRFLRVWLHDPTNVDGAIDIGRLIVDKAVDLTANLKHEGGIRFEIEDDGGELESAGGHLYIPVRGTRRKVTLTLQYMDRSTALGEINAMQRSLSRSRPITVVIDKQDTEFAQDFFFYGYPELDAIGHQVRDMWEHTLTIREITR